MRNKSGKSLVKMLALALSIVCTQFAVAQTFKHVNVKGGVPLVQIAPGGASVWARAANGNPYIFKTNKFVPATSIVLTQLAVGGGNALQEDTVWGLDSSGLIYRAAKSGTSWVFSQVPGLLDFIAVGIGYQDNCHPYEVWGLNPSANIYRYNFCDQSFEQVAGTLGTLVVGGGDIWGINGNRDLFRFDFPTLNFQFASHGCVQATVGPNGGWLLNSAHMPDNFYDFISIRVPGSGTLTQIQAGGDGVWAIGPVQQIYRLDTYNKWFVQVPGSLVSISVGSGGGVWGLDSSGKAYGFSTP